MKNRNPRSTPASLALVLGLGLAAQTAMAQQDSLSHSMQKSMDPQVMNDLMTGMMTNPTEMMTNPIATCAQCHDGSDIARYQQGIGPMMAMMNPANWFSPQAYTNMMAGMMDPKTYELWYNGMMGEVCRRLRRHRTRLRTPSDSDAESTASARRRRQLESTQEQQ